MGYISGVHFQKCSNCSIFFTLKISTVVFSSKGGGQVQGPLPLNTPLYAPIFNMEQTAESDERGDDLDLELVVTLMTSWLCQWDKQLTV